MGTIYSVSVYVTMKRVNWRSELNQRDRVRNGLALREPECVSMHILYLSLLRTSDKWSADGDDQRMQRRAHSTCGWGWSALCSQSGCKQYLHSDPMQKALSYRLNRHVITYHMAVPCECGMAKHEKVSLEQWWT